MNTLFQDLRFGVRMMRKRPGFTAISVLTLALGIGVSTAMFSFVDAVLLKPLGYRDGDKLVSVWETRSRCEKCPPSPPSYLEWKLHNSVFTEVAAYTGSSQSRNLTGAGDAERLQARQVSANYFDMMGVRPIAGRFFQEGEDQIGNEQVAVITYRLWQRRFGADANVPGSIIRLDEMPYTVVGVLPPGGIFDRMDNDLWLPLTIPPDRMRRNTQYFSVRARLKDGVSVEQADAEMKLLSARLSEQDSGRGDLSVYVEPLQKSMVTTDLRSVFLLLMGSVLFILLIACVNVANLMLARGTARRREIVIRLAVGANRLRLIRQLLTESLMLALLGGAAGILVATWLIDIFTYFMPPSTLPDEANVALDSRVLLFTLGASILTGVLFGLIPAWQATKLNLSGVLQENNRGFSARFSRNKSRSLLLVLEIAMTFVLLIGATLMLRSFDRLINVDAGFKPENVLTFRTFLAKERFPQKQQILNFESELLTRLQNLPGVRAVGATNEVPLSGSNSGTDFQIVGRPDGRGNARTRSVSADYFEAIGIRLLKGRLPGTGDTASSAPVAVINEAMANKFWGDDEPVGHQVTFMGPQPFEIIGIVGDVKHTGLSAQAAPEIYFPLAQVPEAKAVGQFGWIEFSGRSRHFVIRTTGDPKTLTSSLQGLVTDIDKDQPLFAVKTMDELVSDSIAVPRFHTFLFVILGGLALVLAAIGIYGVMSYSVSQLTQEVGIRIALGALPRDIFRMVIGQGLFLTAVGLLIGLAGSWYLTRYLSSLLFGIGSNDLITFLAAAIFLTCVALAACIVPARRATRVDPLIALRYE